jgi:hypothetical protein
MSRWFSYGKTISLEESHIEVKLGQDLRDACLFIPPKNHSP